MAKSLKLRLRNGYQKRSKLFKANAVPRVFDVVVRGPGFGGPSHVARLAPLELRESRQVRLARLVPSAVYKEDEGEVQIPVNDPAEVAPALVHLLGELVPVDTAA